MFHFGRFFPLAEPGNFQMPIKTEIAPYAVPNGASLLDASRDPSDSKPGLMDMVEFSETPFLQQMRISLGSFFCGRINFGGFNAVTPTESIERGLPGGGSLDAWAATPMGRGGMILPKDDNRYGLSLTFYYTGSVDEPRNAKWSTVVLWLAEKIQ
jgi:hypothetical protein